jgi:uncharacterized protein with ParB-like and HNH nuclease domain
MAYKSDNIATTIKRLNSQHFLPAIQREFVWNVPKIISLFDSIMRGYPISSFLFWELDDENRANWEVYRFVENARDGGSHNELASVDGVHDLTLVLDGQQRLTSLLVGLKGTYTVKLKYKRWDDPTAWVKQRLYLNLLKDPKTIEEDGEAGIHYEFQFTDTIPINQGDHYWLKVGRILDFDSEDRFYEFRQEEKEKLPDTATKGQMSVFERNLERLYRAIWKDDVIAYYTENDQDYDRALDIFVRANEGGTKLTKSDLLLSMITSKWGGMNARDEIYGFVDRINTYLTRKNDFDKDFIMKSCLVLSDLPVAYKVQNFNVKNLSLIQSKWDEIKQAIENGIDAVNYFGVDRDNLTAANALIPVIYYLLHHPKVNLRGDTPVDVKNSMSVRQWVTMALLNNVFGGSSDNMLNIIRATLQEHSAEAAFPVDAINAVTTRAGRTAYFDSDAIERYSYNTYGTKLTFLALSILYPDNNWGIVICHQDHIFPQAMFSKKVLEKASFSTEKYYRYLSLKDRLGNLELLSSEENQEKSDQPFENWITTRDTTFKSRHLIPDKPELWKFEKFEEFFIERETLIFNRLEKLFGHPADLGKV